MDIPEEKYLFLYFIMLGGYSSPNGLFKGNQDKKNALKYINKQQEF